MNKLLLLASLALPITAMDRQDVTTREEPKYSTYFWSACLPCLPWKSNDNHLNKVYSNCTPENACWFPCGIENTSPACFLPCCAFAYVYKHNAEECAD